MNITLEWKEKYSTGIEEIDFQHQYFLKLIKRFSQLTEEKLDDEYLKKLLQEISYYGVFHFCSEENLMIRSNYDLLRNHQQLHQELIEQLDNEISSIENNRESIIHLIAFLANWFMHHTVEEDIKFAQHLKNPDLKSHKS